MDVQIKKGLLEVCVLAALRAEDSYGYKIITDISEVVEISESTLYPILKRLEASGNVTAYSTEHNGRLRRYYSITEAGRGKIEDFLKDWGEITRIYEFISGRNSA